jgi:hypothetical protein
MEETDLGPFSYFKDSASMMDKAEGHQSVFKSKIERFGNSEEEAK